MPKYLVRARYTKEGVTGSVEEGYARREAYIRQVMTGLGGNTDAFYWALGDDDLFAIFDAEEESMLALSLAVTMGGTASIATTPLLNAAQMDAACARLPGYRAPGT